jgi:4-amino-4-deoxy-L-arabinose transferase-like glycosyltransferase
MSPDAPSIAESGRAAGAGGAREGWLAFAAALAFLFAVHAPVLDLAYHWDEAGQFVPVVDDILSRGEWIPVSVPPNVHAPLVPGFVAGAWAVFGSSPVVTRSAMLLLAAITMLLAFLLARRLAGRRAGWTTMLLLGVSPPFVSQSMFLHLDLPAAGLSIAVLLAYLSRRWVLAGSAGVLLVLAKETGVVVPGVLALLLVLRREWRAAGWILLPGAVALGAWLVALKATTGHWTGNEEFAAYNLTSTLRIERIPLLLLGRLYHLLFANFHWVAALALVVGWRRGALRGGAWVAVAAAVAAVIVLHSVVGGAPLLRYLLPAIALLYVAASAALERLAPRARAVALALLAGGLVVCNFWHPPYPFAWEDDLAVVDYVRSHEEAAAWLEVNAPGREVTTCWPLSAALENPLLGYVSTPHRVVPMDDFLPASLDRVDPASIDLLVLYERNAEPPGGTFAPLERLLHSLFAYEPQPSRDSIVSRFGLESVVRLRRGRCWVEILRRPAP